LSLLRRANSIAVIDTTPHSLFRTVVHIVTE
jgi:hypothetical protein